MNVLYCNVELPGTAESCWCSDQTRSGCITWRIWRSVCHATCTFWSNLYFSWFYSILHF